MNTQRFLELEEIRGHQVRASLPVSGWHSAPEMAKSVPPNGDRNLAPAEGIHPNHGGASEDTAHPPQACRLGGLF